MKIVITKLTVHHKHSWAMYFALFIIVLMGAEGWSW